jgi:hypothetical protein
LEIHHAVRDIVDQVGSSVLNDAESLRGVLDDVLDEDAADVGEVNLLVDAVRFGCFDQLLRLLDTDADPTLAVTTVGAGLARLRGGADPGAASWACAVLGYAVGLVPEGVVRDLTPHRSDADVVPTRPQPATPVMTAVVPSPTRRAEEEASPSRSGRRIVVWLVSVAAGVVVGGLVLLALDGRGPSGAADDDGKEVSSDTSDQDTVQCWNGEPAADVTACSIPTDVAGLAWVFPESDSETCEAEGPGQATKVVQRYCPMALADGGEVQVHYSQWRDHAWMVDHYEAERLGRDVEVGRSDLAAFAIEAPDRLQKLVVFYRDPDAPFSVTVYADSRADLTEAAGRLMIRAVDQLRGLGPGQDDSPASFAVGPSPAES